MGPTTPTPTLGPIVLYRVGAAVVFVAMICYLLSVFCLSSSSTTTTTISSSASSSLENSKEGGEEERGGEEGREEKLHFQDPLEAVDLREK